MSPGPVRSATPPTAWTGTSRRPRWARIRRMFSPVYRPLSRQPEAPVDERALRARVVLRGLEVEGAHTEARHVVDRRRGHGGERARVRLEHRRVVVDVDPGPQTPEGLQVRRRASRAARRRGRDIY